MDSINWDKLKDAFNQAIDLPVDKRAKFVENCDEDFRIQLKKLIKAHENAAQFIAESAMIEIGLVDETDANIGKTIDSYKILEEIGQGGMGTVYRAAHTNESFSQQVALKLIKRGMDTAAVLKRFVMERQILANLEHPLIARLLDVGTTPDGLPYFVMEYIEGLPVTRFCEAHQFSTEERLKLFRKVCSAVSYAHQNLVVHRDLKPSNILVTADGTPKLLDFGIAKLLSPDWSLEKEEATATMFRVMTPEYASPEQIRGLKITTASDVYSLGVVLFVLLTGERPFKIESRSPEEIAQIVLTEEPVRPSAISNSKFQISNSTSENKTLTYDGDTTKNENQKPKTKNQNLKFLKGDLDNIILKALRKEPERRYNSVQEFSEDIRRHLVGLPVTATADTVLYRFNKFVKRHLVGVAASVLVVTTLFSATVITTRQSVVARRERERAEQRFNQVRKLANIILFDYHERIKNLPGAIETRKKLVTDALEYLDNLDQNSDDSPELKRELALAYQKIGEIQSGIAEGGNTGETGAALENYHKALAIQEKLVSMFPENDADRRTLANLYATVGDRTGNLQNREDFCRKAVVILSELAEKDSLNNTTRTDLANALTYLAQAIRSKGNNDEAMVELRRAGEIYENLVLVEENSENRGAVLRRVALNYKTIGAIFEVKNDSVAALELYRKALAVDIDNAAANPQNVQYKIDSAFTYNSLASALTNLGNFIEARENCQKALAIQEKVVADDPKNSFAKYALGRTFRRMGDLLQSLEKFDEAAAHYQKALRIMEELVTADPNNDGQAARLGEFYSVYGNFLYKRIAVNDRQRVLHLREAQNYHKRGLVILSNLKAQNKLTSFNESNLAAAQGSIEIIENDLTKLSKK